MPVMGPGTPSDAQVDELHNSVMEFLKEKHKIRKFTSGSFWDEHRAKADAKLREALKEVLTLDWYEGF